MSKTFLGMPKVTRRGFVQGTAVAAGTAAVANTFLFKSLESVAAAEVAAAEGLVLVDLPAQVPTSGRYWGDASHFSDAGSARAGAAMADGVADAVRKLPEVR